MYISEITNTFPSDERSETESKVDEKLKEHGIDFERVDNDSLSTMEVPEMLRLSRL